MTDESILMGTCNRKKEKKKKNTCYKFCEMSFYINLSNIYRSAEEKLQQGSIKKRAEIIQLEVIFLFILTTYIPLR